MFKDLLSGFVDTSSSAAMVQGTFKIGGANLHQGTKFGSGAFFGSSPSSSQLGTDKSNNPPPGFSNSL
jgi:hypothetical protein